MKQKIFLFAVLLVAWAIPQSVKAYDISYTYQGQTLYYNIFGAEAQVTYQNYRSSSNYSYLSGTLVIPNSVTYNGITYSVTSIGSSAFYGCSGLTLVTIPNSVTSIGDEAFSYCRGLTSVTIPNSVTSIGYFVFDACTGLNSITVDGGNTHYDSRNDCNAIIKTATNTMISGCNTTVIPNSVTSIIGAFSGLSGLTSITIPNSVTYIGLYTFYCCRGLTSITIPNAVTSIDYGAFLGCSGLTSITIPNSVTSIGYEAFYLCSSLTEIISMTSVAPGLDQHAFEYVPSAIPVYIPCGSIESYQSGWNYFSNFIETSFDYELIVSPTDSTRGSVSIITRSSCTSLTTVFSATANYGYHFTQWNDGDTSNPRIVTLTQDTSFTAQFNKNIYEVSVQSADSVKGSVVGGASVEYLDSVTLMATANYGYHFTLWNDGNADNPRTVQVTENKTYTAQFDYNQYDIVLDVDTSIHGMVSGDGSYNYLSERTITATANYGYHFKQWSDGDTNNPRTVTLTQDTSFTAQFNKNIYEVSVQSADSVKGSVVGGASVEYLDSVTLMATANYGYHFTLWNDGNADNPRTVQVTENKTYTAQFDYNQYDIVLDVDTSIHGMVSGDGSYNYLSQRTIAATANYGYHFTQWNDGDTSNPRVINLTQDTMFTAFFASNQYVLTVQSEDESLGNVAGSSTYDYLDTVTISASGVNHHHFVHWNDGNRDNPRQVVITRDTAFIATFAIDTHTVNIMPSDPVRGRVTQSGTEFAYLSPCEVEATAYTGYTFAGWSNGVTANPYTFAVISDVELTAIFVEEGEEVYTVTVVSADPTMGSVSGGGQALSGGTLAISATPNDGYRFLNWNDGNTENPRTVTVTADITYTAYFESTTQGISDVSDNIITVYPNPTSGKVKVAADDVTRIDVYNVNGQQVKTVAQKSVIDISSLPSGVYTMKVETIRSMFVCRVIKE